MSHDVGALKARAEKHGQGHLFQFFSSLSPSSQNKLLEQIDAIEFDVVDSLIAEFLKGGSHAEKDVKLEPPPVIPLPSSPLEKQAEQKAREAGEEAFRKGRVGCFLVAGGQGTRLGLNGPKGAFKVGPITDRTLFQIHAEKILALRRRYKAAVPWLIMTSDANDAETKAFFKQHNYFGMGEQTIRIFKQANMPAVGRDGKILMQSKDEIALSPNGHGGSIKALWDSGAIAWVKSLGVDTLFYFQVDNVLTNIGDPVFIGHHVKARSQMSTKVCRKRDWKEKVGVLGLRNGKLSVIEYSDLPEAVAKEVDANGQLRWWAGNIAIHVLDVAFIEKLNKGGFQLPYHKAEKAVQCIGPDGNPAALKPGEKNGIKFETFVFDALTQADNTLNLETARLEDFSPIKNAEGEDSPATARRDVMEQYARWLTSAGVQIPRKSDGSLDCRIEISPLTSLEGENLEKAPKKIQPGQDVLL
ncbi:MAG TPA: UDPGP type 1 family protein [Planctomycetota bacterium]|nr:UDPGP type 1 family protein [Planctomycetota bacterium]